jgi:hypothetical protein
MLRVEAILALALATVLAGCVLRGKPKVAATPPAPQPVTTVPAAPPQPPPPLSIPQTQVQLPPAQPVDPEALPPTAVAAPEPPADTSPTASSGRGSRAARSAAGSASTPKPEATPPPAPPVATPAPELRAPIQEVIPPSEQKRLQDSAQSRKREILNWLGTVNHRRMTKHQQSTVVLIRGFLKDSDEAEKREDMRQADALAERAQILMRELQNAQQ